MPLLRFLLAFTFLALLLTTSPVTWGQTLETVFSANVPRSPEAGVIQGSDGDFYGTSHYGGASDIGTVFRVNSEGVVTTLVSFNYFNGSYPDGNLVEGSDGNFYGITRSGGAHGYGTIFRITPAGELTTLVSFNLANGRYPQGGLVQHSDGSFYGTTDRGGTNDLGTLFKMTPAGTLTTLVSFGGDSSMYPNGNLLLATDGSFYGTASGGAYGEGTVFRVTPAGVLTTLASFNGTNGRAPCAGLVQDSTGNFYGTTSDGGAQNLGTVFKMTPAGVLTALASFDSIRGASPQGGLLRGHDGNFYGTTESNSGTVFKVTPAGVLTTLVSFSDTGVSKPYAGLVLGRDGNFYGTSYYGGRGGYGTVFKVTPAGALTIVASLNGTKGAEPDGGMIKGMDGFLYGTTVRGGEHGYGTIFKVNAAGEFTTLFSFNGTNGGIPTGRLVQGSDGSLYGTTYNSSTVFKLTPAGELTTIATLSYAQGRNPSGSLAQGLDGNFYGTTESGGNGNRGTVFKVTPTGEVTTLVVFDRTNGSSPRTGLVRGNDGNFYGTTQSGLNDSATVFKVTPAGELTTLASLGSNLFPKGLILGSDGNFYGTLYNPGGDSGSAFKVTPEGELTTLVFFSPGHNPSSGLVEGSDGNFYGTTHGGRSINYGTVFRMTPSGELTTLATFDGSSAAYPQSTPVFGADGHLYGTADLMVIWRVPFPSAPSVTTVAPDVITATGATLQATVNPSGAATEVWFEYGTTTAYGKTTPVQTLGQDNTEAIAVNAGVSLLPHTTYHFRAVAKNWLERSYGADVSFTTPNRPPQAASKTIHPKPTGGVQTLFSLAADASDPDGDALSVTLAEPYTGSGSVTVTQSGVVNYTSGPLAGTQSVKLVVSDGFGGSTPVTITLANAVPVVADDSASTPFERSIEINVLGNDNDGDLDSLRVVSFTQAAHGTVTARPGNKLLYTPASDFQGEDAFTYTADDGLATSSEARVTVIVAAPTDPQTKVLFSNGAAVPGAGQEGSGIPAGSLFKSFGVPAINSAGKLAFTASYGAPRSASELSVFGFEPEAVRSTLVARKGQTAPGTGGAVFASFKDPLLNEAGDIALLASLSGGDTTKKNKEGIWISSSSAVNGLELVLIARSGAQPPGAPAGAQWKSFTALAFSSADADADGGGWSLAFTAFMSSGAGGVKASNDMGLWIARPGGIVLALREGQKLYIGETEKQVRSFAALKALPGSTGQGNGVTTAGGVAVQAFFTDGSQGLLWVGYDGAGDDSNIETLALSGAPVADREETVGKFGLPTQSRSGAVMAWVGSLRSKGNPAAVFLHDQSGPEFLRSLASKDDAAPGIGGATFSTFKSVAVNDSNRVLLHGRVKGKGISKANDEGLWWRPTGDHAGSLQLIARKGAEPPGFPKGARWSAFTSLALPEGDYGPLFAAKLAGVNSSTDQGLWALDEEGKLHLVIREGQPVAMKGSNIRKTLKSFTVLGAVPGSPAQRRSFGDSGRIVYRAFFTDNSQAVVTVQLP